MIDNLRSQRSPKLTQSPPSKKFLQELMPGTKVRSRIGLHLHLRFEVRENDRNPLFYPLVPCCPWIPWIHKPQKFLYTMRISTALAASASADCSCFGSAAMASTPMVTRHFEAMIGKYQLNQHGIAKSMWVIYVDHH